MTNLQHILIDGVDYQIALPHQDTDYIQGKIAKEGAPYELPMLRAMAGRLSKGDLVLDVGANIGNHSLYLAATGCSVHAFEPNSALCAALRQSVETNGFESSLQVYNVGVGAEVGTAHFKHLDSSNLGAQSLAVDHDDSGDINIIRLDDLDFNQPVKAIKIDVEGMELAVLQGAARLIERDRPALYVECQTEEDFLTIQGWVSRHGYLYWDTFNATPTHLFIDERTLTEAQRVERLMIKAVRDSYRDSARVDQLKHSLDEAREKYRSASQNIVALKERIEQGVEKQRAMQEANTTLKKELQDCNLKYRNAGEQIATLKAQIEQSVEKQRAMQETNSALQQELLNSKTQYQQLSEQLAALQEQFGQRMATKQQVREELSATSARYQTAQQQIAHLQKELSRNGHKYRQLTSTQIPALKEKLASQQQRCNELFLRAEQLNMELQKVKQERADALRMVSALRSSHTFKAGQHLRSAAGSLKDALKLPVRLWRLNKQAKQRAAVSDKGPAPVTTQPPAETPTLPKRHSAPKPTPSLQALNAAGIKSLRIACIMDEFTFGSYAPECDLHQLTPDHWETELESCQPELLFIESAWRGKDELWGSKVGHTSKELQGIVAWCRKHGIPTVFWNKEDPVHFETFLNTARLFDFVFTTDLDCIHRYKAALEHDRVFFLPFACQPTVHNPIEKYERKDAFCFAGAYYVRYPERTRDLEDFVRELPAFRPLEIYDRNYGKDDPNYQFPAAYQPYIVGTLPFEQIDKAYKGYRYAINLNSIKQSQTMFARRVFELLGSNTLVASNYSRGVRLMFGDLVVTSDSGAEIKRRFEALQNESRIDRLRLAGLRKVMLEHTYGERIAYVLSKVTGQDIASPMPTFKVLATADTIEAAQRLVTLVQAQQGVGASLSIVLSDTLSAAEVRAALPEHAFPLELLAANDIQAKKLAELAGDADWIAGMNPEDHYGPHYLLDIALATRYSDALAIGKGAWHAWQQDQCLLHAPDAAYRPAARLAARRSAIARTLAQDIDATQWLATLGDWRYEYPQQLAIDPYNYCANASKGDPDAIRNTVDDLPANQGIRLSELTGIAEAMPPMQHQEVDTPYLNGRELAHLLAGKPFQLHTSHEPLSTEEQVDEAIHLSRNTAVDTALSGSTLQIRSELPDGTHEYLYAPVEIDCNELLANFPETIGRNIPFHLEMEPGLNLSLVVLYLDAEKNRIDHIIEQPNRNHCIDLPDGAAYLRFGLRVYAGGATRIKRLLLGHLDLEPQEILGQSDVLLLTNHYPSYDDLYRNGFVHSRVRAYRERGVNVDVFRLREDQPISWHEFQDIDATTGSQEALRRLLASGRYRHVLVHFLDPAMWTVLKDFIDTIPVTTWIHGAEIHPWYRRKFNIHTPEQEQAAKAQSEQRMAFWRGLLQPMPANLKLVFVSKTFSEEVMEDLGFRLPKNQYTVIHNPIDTELFAYTPKPPDQRTKILSIRPYASRIYANDLSVEAIKLLSIEPFFNELEFRLIGDGELFEETVEPVREFSNVTVEKRFLTQHEIASLHKEYGIFLCPSRMDTQGVSRDEAMSSGLVPVTSAIAAIPEFVDEDCGILAPAENSESLAQGISKLYTDPDQFAALSRNAAKRVRKQSGKELVITQEINVFARSSVAGTSTPEKSA